MVTNLEGGFQVPSWWLWRVAGFEVWYPALLVPTLLALAAVPFTVASPRHRRLLGGLLAGLALVELGLVLLLWSRLACWSLIALGVSGMAFASPRRSSRPGAVSAVMVVAVGAGGWFQFAPAPLAFHVYLGVALPALLALAGVLLLADEIRWSRDQGIVVAVASVAAFVGFVPASMFGPGFLRWFELAHTPFLLVVLGGVLLFALRGSETVTQARSRGLAAADLGNLLSRSPEVQVSTLAAGALGASLVTAAVGIWVPQVAGWSPGALAAVGLSVGAFLLSMRALAPAAGSRTRAVASAGAGAAIVLAGLLASLAISQVLVATPSLAARLVLYFAGVATTSGVFLATVATSCLYAENDREAVEDVEHRLLLTGAAVEDVVGLRALVTDVASPPGREALAEYADQARAVGGPVVLRLMSSGGDPLWTVPEETYVWLEAQDDPDHRVHLAILEGGSVFMVPPLGPSEVRA